MEKYLTCERVAEKYGVTVCTVREWIKGKKLPALKLAGAAGYRIRSEDLDAFEKRHFTTAKEEA